MVQVSYPGVYIQEIPSGVRTIAAVSTSVTLFVGRTFTGDPQTPTVITSFADFERAFGTLEQNAPFGEMAQQVKQFFLNGGQTAWIVRLLGAGADTASVSVGNTQTGGAPATAGTFSALYAGEFANEMRVQVRFAGANPNDALAIDLDLDGVTETYTNLSMDPDSNRFAPSVLANGTNSESASTLASFAGVGAGSNPSLAQSATFIPGDDGGPDTFGAFWQNLTVTEGKTTFRISVDGGATFSDVVLSGLGTGVSIGDATTAISNAIDAATPVSAPPVVVSFLTPTSFAGDLYTMLRLTCADGDLAIQPAASNDVAVALGLGNSAGGFVAGRFAHARPQPSGSTVGSHLQSASFADYLFAQGAILQADWNNMVTPSTIDIDGTSIELHTASISGNVVDIGLSAALDALVDAVNGFAGSNPGFAYRAERNGYRVRVFRANVSGLFAPAPITFGGPVDTAGGLQDNDANLDYYSLGVPTATGGFVTAGPNEGLDGSAPDAGAYEDAYLEVERDVDLFNLLVLPRDSDDPNGTDLQALWARASVFCQEQRAFLLVDPPKSWDNVQDVISGPNDVNALRVGLVNDHAAVYFPEVTIAQDSGPNINMGPSGTIAGLMARTDANRGVWKAPAGTEAELRGTVGLEFNLSDRENGLINPRGVNALRVFPNGLVSWGARTLDGDNDFGSEWAYVPVRRTALFIEESLYRGLRFAVFEPNDEPLWSDIRLNAGAFMNNLFRQGAFQGQTAREAYFVKCDSDTTTQNDINLGIVNVIVGFAPLKPAEFVVLKIQQLAGQVQT